MFWWHTVRHVTVGSTLVVVLVVARAGRLARCACAGARGWSGARGSALGGGDGDMLRPPLAPLVVAGPSWKPAGVLDARWPRTGRLEQSKEVLWDPNHKRSMSLRFDVPFRHTVLVGLCNFV